VVDPPAQDPPAQDPPAQDPPATQEPSKPGNSDKVPPGQSKPAR
jgi:hypothetical protein